MSTSWNDDPLPTDHWGHVKIEQPEPSEWRCYLFGGVDIVWTPNKGNEPNWFWRVMQFLAFGNRWVRNQKT